MSSKQVYLIGAVALLCIAAIAFGRVDSVTINVLKGAFTLDKTSLVKAVDQILVLNGPGAPAAQKVLIGDIETLAYEHPISDGLRQLENEGKGPWKYLERQVTVVALNDSHLDERAAQVCQGGEFSSESFVIFAPDKVDVPFKQFVGVRDAPCPEGKTLVWISPVAYRGLFGDGADGITQTAKAKRFPLKPSIILPSEGQLAAMNK